MTPLAAKALEIAETQMGIIEEKNNSGPHVEKYLASVGLGKGNPWCMAFVYWCCQQSLGARNPLVKTGGVLRQWHEIDPRLKVKEPKKGDIFFMDFGDGKGHTGFVLEDGQKSFSTVEGNSNAAGSRTGGMVCSNKRKVSSCLGFVRLPNLSPTNQL